MNELQIFENSEFGTIRMVEYNDQPYAVGIDVANILEYAYPSQAVGKHCKGIVKLAIPSRKGLQETSIIPVGDICRLIVKAADQSKNNDIKVKAERFEKWIYDEVVPAINKHGMYATDEMLDRLVESPDLVISIATKLKEEKAARIAAEEAKKQLEVKAAEDAPKVEFYDHAVENSGLFNITTTAKIVGIGRDTMCKALRDMDILYWQKYNGQNINVPFQTQIDQKHCFLKMRPKKWGSMSDPVPQAYFTVKGIEYIRRKLKERGIIKEDVAC